MNNKIRVVVSGAGGRMGKEVVKLVLQDEELELAAAVDRSSGDIDAGRLVGLEDSGVIVTSDLEAAPRGKQRRCPCGFHYTAVSVYEYSASY